MRRKLDSSDEDEEEGIEEEIGDKFEDAVTTAKSVMLQKRAMMTKMVNMKMESTTGEGRRQRKEETTATMINY